MKKILLTITFFSLSFFSYANDQYDAQLNNLFNQLKSTGSSIAAKEIETKIDAPIRKKEAQNRGALFRTNLKNLQKQEKILANLERLQAKGATESRADKIKQRQQIIRDLELKLGRQSGAGPIVNAPVSAPTTKTTNISQISKSFTTKDPVLEQVAMESFP